jgi:alkanesulfonate monooxygenase SsuD/methylene tetrahydromethanopterin reductase-like flavin-dependent oxidoreductase (luciferase family)
MRFGAHLPLMDFGGHPYTFAHLASYARRASALGFETLAVNDHLVFAAPWLDGPTALASVIGDSGTMTLGTTVSLPVVRGPVPLQVLIWPVTDEERQLELFCEQVIPLLT